MCTCGGGQTIFGKGILELIVVVLFLVPTVINYKIANKKHRNTVVWILLGFFPGWISTVILLFLKARGS